jgi:hypothetical protein
MTRVALALAFLLAHLLSTRAPVDEVRGAWSAAPREAGVMRIELSVRDRLLYAEHLTAAAFAGLAEGDVDSRRETPVRFRLAREAGTFTLEGSFHRRSGAGRFRFTPSAHYLASLRALGIDTAALAGAKRPSRALLDYALLDVSATYIRSLQREGCREPAARAYLELRASRVTPEDMRELRHLGYTELPASQIVELWTHGVFPEVIRALKAEGYTNLPPPELVRLRIARVTPDKIREYRRLGYGHLTPGQLVALSIRGSTASPTGLPHAPMAGVEGAK